MRGTLKKIYFLLPPKKENAREEGIVAIFVKISSITFLTFYSCVKITFSKNIEVKAKHSVLLLFIYLLTPEHTRKQ